MKKTLAYLRYFFYIGLNWNFRLAIAIIYYEIKGENKYGLNTIGIDDLSTSVNEDDRKHASIYQPVNYYIAEWLLNQTDHLDVNKKTCRLLDAGCGKGRVLFMAAHYGFKKITGFDLSPAMCHIAIQNIELNRSAFPDTEFEIIHSNASDFEVSDDTGVIFMFNPFNKHVMEKFAVQIQKSLEKTPREMIILYANPECKDILLNIGFHEINSIKKLSLLQGLVLSNKKDR
ncbi:MAG: class I SAM-dependent methyltransferase [Chitinophagaceae bacterium]|nr:class I SAM-dependent methyltransferase [Chitinophagaceae bacterium]